jgi:hypothetical protein
MKLNRLALVTTATLALLACGRGESRITSTRLMDATAPPSGEPAAPLEVESVSLLATTDPDAQARDWVECVGGQLEWAGGKALACKERERAWVDPERDELTLVVAAEGALLARAKVSDTEVEAPFVDGRARLRVKLRPAFGALLASAVSERTRLEVALEVESQSGDAKGVVWLETPRVARLLESALGGPVVLSGGARDAGASGGERRAAIFLGPEPKRLPPNPEVPLALLERVVLDVGVARLVLPCPDAAGVSQSVLRGGREHRPLHLKVIELATGRLVGEKVLGAEPPACGEAMSVGPDEVANAVEVLVAGGPSEAPEQHLGWPVKDPMGLLRVQRFLGLGRGASAAEVGAVLGVGVGEGAGPWLGDGAVSAFVTDKGLEEIRVLGQAGVDILKTKRIDPKRKAPSIADGEPLLALLDQPLELALGELGRPSHFGRGFAVWTVDQAALTIYVELRCDPEGERRCRELRVGSLQGKDPHEGGDVPGAKANPHSHRHPNDDGHGHDHGHDHDTPKTPPDSQP